MTTKRMKKRILITLSAILACLLVSMSVAPHIICGVIFSRTEEPDLLAPDYDALPSPPVRTECRFESDGETLCGYLYEVASPRGLIVVAHGLHASADAHLPETLAFLEAGWTVFAYDGTGAGESGGDSAIGLEQGAIDLLCAIDYITADARLGSLPLMLYGHSMGAYAAAIASARPEVKGAVCIAGFDSPMDILAASGRDYVGPLAMCGYPFLSLYNRLTFGDAANESAVEAINASSAAFLIVHGSHDTVIADTDSLYGHRAEISNPNATYLLIDEPGRDGHSGAHYTADAMGYRASLEADLAALSEAFGEQIPDDVLAAFAAEIDGARLFATDPAFLSAVLDFYASLV